MLIVHKAAFRVLAIDGHRDIEAAHAWLSVINV